MPKIYKLRFKKLLSDNMLDVLKHNPVEVFESELNEHEYIQSFRQLL